MDLLYSYPGAAHSVETVMEFTSDDRTAFWSEPFFHFFPDIDRARFCAMSVSERKRYLMEYFTAFERENEGTIRKKLALYNAEWAKNRAQVTAALEDAFSLDLSGLFNDMKAYMSFCPVCPRYLESSSFDVFWLNSERGALGLSLHEIIHFVWFRVWHEVFRDQSSEYETPHLKWILSEMAVEPIMRDERLRSVNPYFDDGCVYPYFYTMTIDRKPVLDLLYDMYRSMPIKSFMVESYALLLRNESAVRDHISKNERGA